MKRKQIVAGALCIFFLSGCSSSSLVFNDTNNSSTNSADIADSIGDLDSSNEADTNATDSNDDSDSNADIPWNSPMADYIPDSPFSSYISFVNGEISTRYDDESLSDYITGDYKYICCDLSGDGVPELVLSYFNGEEDRLIAFSYDSETGEVYKALDRRVDFEYDCISEYGFILISFYEDADGTRYNGISDDEAYSQRISVVLTGKDICDSYDPLYEWGREAGCSEYDGPSEEIYDRIMEMAEDKVTLSEGTNLEDMIPYLEECEENFEKIIEEFKLSRQQGNGLVCGLRFSEIPDKKYKDAESAYEAFLNNETCVRCEYGTKTYQSYFSSFYGNKYMLSSWYDQDNDVTMESRYIDCGSDGKKELVVDITDNSVSEPMDDTYVIVFYEGHLYLKFTTSSWSRSDTRVGDTGYVISSGSSSMCVSGQSEAVLDADVIFHEIYDVDWVSGEGNKEYFPDAYENAVAGEFVTMYIYHIDGQEYYVPYYDSEEVTKEKDYTDFMKACVECGITFSTQKEVDELIKAKKAEYGF